MLSTVHLLCVVYAKVAVIEKKKKMFFESQLDTVLLRCEIGGKMVVFEKIGSISDRCSLNF